MLSRHKPVSFQREPVDYTHFVGQNPVEHVPLIRVDVAQAPWDTPAIIEARKFYAINIAENFQDIDVERMASAYSRLPDSALIALQ
jgi:hypothetical protein